MPDTLMPDVPVTFLHGWAGSARGTWLASGIPDRLRALGRSCFVPDLPGHGIPVPGSPPRHDPAQYDDIVGEVAAGLPGRPMDIVGYSLGAKIALWIAIRMPQLVRSLTLVAVGDNLFAAEGSGVALGAMLAGGIGADAPERLRRMAVYAFQSGADPHALAACLQRRWTPPVEDALRAIRVPILLALAEQDELVRATARLHACLPDARICTLRGQDHLSAPYAPELAEMVVRFVGSPYPARDAVPA